MLVFQISGTRRDPSYKMENNFNDCFQSKTSEDFALIKL